MAGGRVFSLLPIALLISVLAVQTSVHGIGVNYGLVADNLPQPSAVVELYKSNNIGSMRIFNPNHDVLEALRGSNISLIVDQHSSLLARLHVSTSIALTVLGSSYPPSADVVVIDGPYGYKNLFDAMLDATYVAMEKVGGAGVAVVVSESGWPSDGGYAANISNAQTYNQNLINHNQKEAGTERNFGLFYPDKNPVYPISFSPSQQPPLDPINSNGFNFRKMETIKFISYLLFPFLVFFPLL
uniref:Beta-1,3 glucanase 5 n=1 Tax=Musa AB Group TaxID=485393 RepID=A0A097I517_MUSPR|nr:beta-1,3 glucanase 5 [Musa AB Group]